jgi:hypothetical protein
LHYHEQDDDDRVYSSSFSIMKKASVSFRAAECIKKCIGEDFALAHASLGTVEFQLECLFLG